MLDVAVIGAGPFGLSIAAHLPHRRVRVFGEPMQTWRTRMPPGMRLRSDWEKTSLSAAGGRGTIDEWVATGGGEREEPIPLASFLRYADWFREEFVADVDRADVARLDRAGDAYRLTTSGGEEAAARNVVFALGVTPFPHAPEPFAAAVGEGVSFATDVMSAEGLQGRRVVVVGGGQGGLEAAAVAARRGAEAELVVRSAVRWFADHEPHHPRGRLQQRLFRLAYPAVGYGPPPLNRLILAPDAFAALPPPARRRLAARVLRAGGSPWVREQVEGHVAVTEGVAVTGLDRRDGGLRLSLSDGSTREADRVVLATGFRFSLDRIGFLAPAVAGRVEQAGGWPVLDRWFRSRSAPDLLFVGFAAERRFGPIARFVSGADFTARRVGAALGRRGA